MSIRLLHQCALTLLIALLAGCRDEIVLDSLSAADANRAAQILSEAGIEARRESSVDKGWVIKASPADTARALGVLDARRLTRPRPTPVEGESLFLSESEQRLRFARATAEQIELTISTLDGVIDTRVQLNLPPLEPFKGSASRARPASASVVILSREGFAASADEIAALVGGAAGVDPAAVHVLITPRLDDVVPVPQERPAQSATLSVGLGAGIIFLLVGLIVILLSLQQWMRIGDRSATPSQ